jgi:hypothetical protein
LIANRAVRLTTNRKGPDCAGKHCSAAVADENDLFVLPGVLPSFPFRRQPIKFAQ